MSDQKFLPCSSFQRMIFLLENPPISVSWVYLPCFAGHTIRVARVFIYSIKQESSKNIASPFMATFQTAGLSAFSASGGATAHWSGDRAHHVSCSSSAGLSAAAGSPSYLWKLPCTFDGPKGRCRWAWERLGGVSITIITEAFKVVFLSFFFFFTTPLSPLPRLLIQLCNLPNA